MILEQSVAIAAPPERIWDFFRRMEKNYTRWHPDHIAFRWLGPGDLEVGNGFYFEERIHGQHLKRTVHFTEIVPNRLIAFRPDNRFVRLFLPRIAFAIAPDGAGCRFTQTIRVRIGPIGRRLNQKAFAAVGKHMREEGENLKAIAEAGG